MRPVDIALLELLGFLEKLRDGLSGYCVPAIPS